MSTRIFSAPERSYNFLTVVSLKNVDIESALRRIADRRIEEAMKQGKFDNLKGMGEPLDLEPMPAEENARMTWWMLRILKRNDFTPDEVRLRKRIEQLKSLLKTVRNPRQLSARVAQINTLVKKLNTLGTNAINLPVTPVDPQIAHSEMQTRLEPSEHS
jgi:predicted component of type VI protein secretion system